MMKVRGLIYIFLLLIFSVTSFIIKAGFFGYDRAISQAQQGNLQGAQEKLKKLVVENPDAPDLLYDLGVVSFKNKEFDKAAAYFQEASESDKAPEKLKEQALLNLGNTNVKLEKLEEAIKNYEEVLKINPKNGRANCNLEIVKKMLQKQKQDQQKQDQQKKDKDKQEDKKERDQKQKDQEQKEKEQEQKDKKESADKEKQQDKPREDQKDKREKPKDDLKKKEEPQKQEKRDQDDREKSETREQEKDTRDKQTKHDKDDKTKEEKDQVKKKQEQPVPAKPRKGPELDKRTVEILQAVENLDKQGNKELMKATVSKQMAGKYGEKSW